jgi:hypothetical protein
MTAGPPEPEQVLEAFAEAVVRVAQAVSPSVVSIQRPGSRG